MIEHFQKCCSRLAGEEMRAVFLGFDFVSAQSQGCWRTCSFAKASPKPKNPRSKRLQYFFKRSSSLMNVKMEMWSKPLPMKILSTLFCVFLAVAAVAADNPYNEAADARLDIKQALTQAATNQTPVIIVFGANWCGDCKMLDHAMKNGSSAPLFAKDFKIVKVNVGRFDKNVDVAKSYGVPLAKGIPAVAIISPKSEVLYVTKEGELANARKMGENGIYDFFKKVTAETKAKK